MLILYTIFTEWFEASNSNICYLTYAFENLPGSTFKTYFYVRKLVTSGRLKHGANVASTFILKIRDHCRKAGVHQCLKMSQLTVLGFSMGAHIAAEICVELYVRTGQEVGKLIGKKPIH